MFETSVVRSRVAAARRSYSLVSVLVAHSAAIVGAVAVSVATVDFPTEAPDQFAQLRPLAAMTIPPPLGTPEGNNRPRQPEPQRQATPPPVQQPSQQTAPSIVPEATPEVAEGPATDGPVDPNAEPGTGPRGVPGGDPNSVLTDLDIPLTNTTPVEDNKLYTVSGDVKAPKVITRVEPRFPQPMVTARMSGSVTVRCIIDRNGTVRDVQVVRSTFSGFEPPVLEALPKWRFAPGSLNGRAVDTIFELTVHFNLNR